MTEATTKCVNALMRSLYLIVMALLDIECHLWQLVYPTKMLKYVVEILCIHLLLHPAYPVGA